jgi:YHS domain-containing protein
MKTRWLAVAAAVLGMCAAPVISAEKESKAKCPVSGKPAKADVTADYLGKKVQFCCEGCPSEFKANTAKYAAKANAQLVATGEAVQVGCPFSGGPVNPATKIDVDGAEVGFCCNNCKAKAEKAENKLDLVFAKLGKGFTTQTTCPVSGKPISAKQSVEYKGSKVYFCCGGCPEAFNKDPEKFAAKLPKAE